MRGPAVLLLVLLHAARSVRCRFPAGCEAFLMSTDIVPTRRHQYMDEELQCSTVSCGMMQLILTRWCPAVATPTADLPSMDAGVGADANVDARPGAASE